MNKFNELIRVKSFQTNNTKDKLSQIEILRDNFLNLANELKEQIELEEENTGINDQNHYAYSPIAKSCILRHEKLMSSIKDLEAQKENITAELNILEDELLKLQKKVLEKNKAANL